MPRSLQDLPTPTPHSPRASRCPGPFPPRGHDPYSSVLDPPNCGTKDPAAAGELGGKDWCSRYIPGPVGCHAADTPAAPAARARHATPAVATPARRRGCTRDPPRGARAQDSPAPVSSTWLRLPPRLGGHRGCVRRRVPHRPGRRFPPGKVGERHRLSCAPAQSPSESERDRGSEL